jgi:hypothetical protein
MSSTTQYVPATKTQRLTIEVRVPDSYSDPDEYVDTLAAGLRDQFGTSDRERFDIRLVEFQSVKRHLPPVNRKLLADVVAWAAAEDAKAKIAGTSEWHQAAWISQLGTDRTGNECGTAFCLAGKVAVTEGWVPETFLLHAQDPEQYPLMTGYDWSRVAPKDTNPYEFSDYSRGVSEVAREALGLTEHEAGRLFEGNNNIETILAIAQEIVEARDEQDAEVEA